MSQCLGDFKNQSIFCTRGQSLVFCATDFLSAHGDAHGVAPLADLRIAQTVDGFVGPLGRRGGKRLRVHIAGRGVVGEQSKAFAIAASRDRRAEDGR